MTRQTWQLIVGVGWCALLSACSPTAMSSRCGWTNANTPPASQNPVEVKGRAEESEPATQVVKDASPYHPIQSIHPLIKEPPVLAEPPTLRAVELPKENPLTPPTPAVALPAKQPEPTPTPPNPPQPAMKPVGFREVPPDLAPGLVAALEHMIKNRPTEAFRALQHYSPQTQEYLLRLLPTLAILDQKGIEKLSQEDVANLQEQLTSLMQTLRARANLVIDRMCCCEYISGFGSYKVLPPDHEFQPTQGKRPGELVQIYLELRNFASERQDGYYITRLDTTVKLVDEHKGEVWRKSFNDGLTPLRSLTPRNDCFNKYTFCVPPRVAPGRYQLTIQIEDQTRQPHRLAEKTIDFVIGSGQ